MTLADAIPKRRAVREYEKGALPDELLDDIATFISTVTPLDPALRWRIEIMPFKQFSRQIIGRVGVKAPYYLAVTAEREPGYLQNAGYVTEQVVLYLTGRELGTCWLGGAHATGRAGFEMPFCICVAFGTPDQAVKFRSGAVQFHRKALEDLVPEGIPVGDTLTVLEAARLAPSAMNLQPWRFAVHKNRTDIFRIKPMMRLPPIKKVQSIDIGIAMCHIDMQAKALGKKAEFKKRDGIEKPGLIYEASMKFK